MANRPSGFTYELVGDDVLISHHGRRAATLRGPAARRFLTDVVDDPQQLMARVTGNYKRGKRASRQGPPTQPGTVRRPRRPRTG